jgi:hypothetical protein
MLYRSIWTYSAHNVAPTAQPTSRSFARTTSTPNDRCATDQNARPKQTHLTARYGSQYARSSRHRPPFRFAAMLPPTRQTKTKGTVHNPFNQGAAPEQHTLVSRAADSLTFRDLCTTAPPTPASNTVVTRHSALPSTARPPRDPTPSDRHQSIPSPCRDRPTQVKENCCVSVARKPDRGYHA